MCTRSLTKSDCQSVHDQKSNQSASFQLTPRVCPVVIVLRSSSRRVTAVNTCPHAANTTLQHAWTHGTKGKRYASATWHSTA